MAYTLDVASVVEVLSLQDYVEQVEATVDFSDDESIAASAPALRALANNKTFLVEWMNDQLLGTGTVANGGYGAQTLCPARGSNFVVRVNLWFPVRTNSPNPEYDIHFLSYDLAHDHDFSFLTVGYYGAGYQTQIYEYDPSKVIGYAGEAVNLSFLETTTLTEGKVMLYRESRDVHTQDIPSEMSVSLNLLGNAPSTRSHSQYLFDLEAGRIRRPIESPRRHNGSCLFRMAAALGDESTSEIVGSLVGAELSAHSRWFAAQALLQLDPVGAKERLERQLRVESSPLMRHHLASVTSP